MGILMKNGKNYSSASNPMSVTQDKEGTIVLEGFVGDAEHFVDNRLDAGSVSFEIPIDQYNARVTIPFNKAYATPPIVICQANTGTGNFGRVPTVDLVSTTNTQCEIIVWRHTTDLTTKASGKINWLAFGR